MVVVYSRADKIFRRIVTAGALTSLMLLGLIAAFLIFRSWDTFSQFGINFITGSEWFRLAKTLSVEQRLRWRKQMTQAFFR